ncbi:hypothetical protein V5O48_010756 [Marasmius crinis-equi]|uniref:Uncharacterized protein n=1 Tax=Marasmius crinis-equi TaxID=585013 RepID=A0ABR3F7G5_9AGAR
MATSLFSSSYVLPKRWIETYTFGFGSAALLDKENYAWQWLSQAIHHFTVTNILREEWSWYSLRWQAESFELRPVTISSPDDDDEDARQIEVPQSEGDHIYSPYYLFILPPSPLSSAPDLESWRRERTLYYWSLDPDGASVMSEEQRISLGLPSYTIKFQSTDLYWPAEVYDFMRLWQEAKGFDPTTTDFARSLGHSILEVLPQQGDDRFETVADADADGVPFKARGEDMEVESLVDSTYNGPSSESREPPTQTEMDVEMDAVPEDMEVDR